MSDSKSSSSLWKTIKPFVNGGCSGMLATCCIQPIDMVKVRIQLGSTGGPFGVATNIIRTEGFGALYKGLGAGLLRQATYTTARMGIFQTLNDEAKKRYEGKQLPLWVKASCGLTAGGLGSLVGNPADLALIRLQAEGTLPPAERRGYKNVFDALYRISTEEGFGALFTGAGPTVVRAMALNMGMLASNEQAKDMLVNAGFAPGSFPVIGGAAMIAGFFASFFSLPFDFVKTRLQKQKPGPDGKLPYAGFADCAYKTLTQEGPLKFYTGFPTYYVRIAPHAVLTLVFIDFLKKAQASAGM